MTELPDMIGAYRTDIIAAIIEEAGRTALPEVLLLALGYGEDTLGLGGVGDGGHSFGVFQIYDDVHGKRGQAYWEGVGGVHHAVAEMQGNWLLQYAALGGREAFDADPEHFLYQWWPKAQVSEQPSWQRVVECISVATELFATWQTLIAPPPPPPAPPPDLSPAWQLRVGLANRLAGDVYALTNSAAPPEQVLAAVRVDTTWVTGEIDKAGGAA